MVEEPPKRTPNWITLSVLGAVMGVGVYVYTIGSEIGAMRQQTANQEFRINALEEHGSGPVQANAAKVEALTARADRILTELLNMQQRMSEVIANQQSNNVVLQRLQQDFNDRNKDGTK